MEFVITGTDEQWEELTASAPGVSWTRAARTTAYKDYPNSDAFFILEENASFNELCITKPVFINNLNHTLAGLKTAENIFRINGWKGFLKRSIWEVAGDVTIDLESIAAALGKKLLPVADEPGLVTARVVAMIINEAYFTVGDGISTKEETDIAMKLGTNYPHGPFEWAALIGIQNIYTLLSTLAITDKRYTPAPLLEQEANKK